MRTLMAKEYEVGQIPLSGEYAIYKSGRKFFFTIGNGCTPVENLASSIEIPEEMFLSLKKTYEEFSSEKDPSSPYDEEKVDRKENKTMEQEFRFETYDQVKVINSGQQYTTHWEAYGKLMHEWTLDRCAIGIWDNSFIIGTHLKDENLENTVFQVVARDRIGTSCGEKNLYLIISQADYDAIKSREIGEKGEPAKIFVIEEDGLEEYSNMNVWFCEYKPINGQIYVNLKCTEKDMKRNGFPLDTVDETARKSYCYYVHVKAIDSCDAKAKAKKLFTEYFSKLYNKKSKEYEAELEEISDNLYKVRHLND